MNEFDRFHDLLAARIRCYPSNIKGDAMCGEAGALREIHRIVQTIRMERDEERLASALGKDSKP